MARKPATPKSPSPTTSTRDLVAELEARMAAEVAPVESALSPEARELAAALEPTPPAPPAIDISRLPDAIVDGALRPTVGDRIVIERRASFLPGRPYLDTKTYRIHRLDPNGNMSLWDESLNQWAMDNWKTGPMKGNVYKVPSVGVAVTTKRKRGRPRKNPVEPPKPVVVGPDGAPVKRGRGRPKGAKNRAKEVIAAEKAEKRRLRAAKMAKKKKPASKAAAAAPAKAAAKKVAAKPTKAAAKRGAR